MIMASSPPPMAGYLITFMATVTYGATIVPVLQDFNPSDAANIIDHSDAILLFVADGLFQSP